MKRLFLLVLIVGMAVAAPTPMRTLLSPPLQPKSITVSQAGNAAFRDGLYLGRFDAESGRLRHLCVGRWSADTDRAWFTAGYQAGYQRRNAARATEE